MWLDWTPLVEVLQTCRRFVITSHVRPDGDALGSSLAMAELVRSFGLEALVVSPSPIPSRYSELLAEAQKPVRHFGVDLFESDLLGHDALIILDLSSWNRLGSLETWARRFTGSVVVIDHHVSGDSFPGPVLKATASESTATLVLDAFRVLDRPISRLAAQALFTGISTDTGWFRHPNTTAQTLRDAASLVGAGAEPSRIHRALFETNRFEQRKLVGVALNRLQIHQHGRFAITSVKTSDFESTGARLDETEDLIDSIVGIEGVELVALLVQLSESKTKVSFRSRGSFNCAELAGKLEGGGHVAAAGASIADSFEAALDRVMKLVDQHLAESSNLSTGRDPFP